ncbi:hypothetical protein NQ314_016378 [Rhamnusium bicolor]|uniref:Uncharacterized protein n=1 Tax=Rhamnusium bicolor TaxID=1586634 RepID=A0AAV8WWJ7_9CUCU|nr:hypothetical protein NQ314_016378 [Rhamnusium bicolor]
MPEEFISFIIMVIIQIKHKDENQFLFESTLNTSVENLVTSVVAIYNGRLKIYRICSEMEELSKHGTLYPPEILGLTEEQVEELKLTDPWGEKMHSKWRFCLRKRPHWKKKWKEATQRNAGCFDECS